MSNFTQPTDKSERVNEHGAVGLSTGLAIGAGLGVVIWLTSGHFIFFPIFVGAGLSIGTALDAQKKQKTEDDA